MRKMVGNAILEEIDWSLPDAEIARIVGVSRERVRQVRKAENIGKPELYRTHGVSIAMYNWISDHEQELRDRAANRELSVEEIKEESGLNVGVSAIVRLLDKFGIKCPITKTKDYLRKYRRMNWDLPNCDLAEIWGYHPVVVAKYRRLLNDCKGRWNGRSTYSYEFQQSDEYQEYLKAYMEEKDRARSGTSHCATGASEDSVCS